MGKGLIITNGFAKGRSFANLRESLERAAEIRGLDLESVTHDRLLFDGAHKKPLFDAAGYSFGIFWDKDVRLARQLEAAGLRLFNSARAVELCDDKSLTHLALAGKLAMPRTVFVPVTFKYVGYGDMGFVDRAAEYLGLPVIIKECRGSFGRQVYLAETVRAAKDIIAKRGAVPMLMQEAVAESLGRDIRLYVVGDRVIGAIRRENPGDFRANIAGGGRGTAYDPTTAEVRMGLEAVKLLGLDFGGVDILQSARGPLLCEVNSNAHFAKLAECTGADVAGEIIGHIISETAGSRE